jgi:hypothetical protein
MKTRPLLFAVAALMIPLLHAGEPLGVNALHQKLPETAGTEITVTGLVDRISAARRMVVLIDTSEASCKDACERKLLVVTLPESAEMPAKGSFLTATGKLTPDADPPQLLATNLVQAAP